MPSRSRTARAYSARLARWNGRDPGIGIERGRAIDAGFERGRELRAAASPSGRWRRAAASCRPEASESSSRRRPRAPCRRRRRRMRATDLPALPRSLWQVAQYCLTIAVCSAVVQSGLARGAVRPASLGRGAAGRRVARWLRRSAPRTLRQGSGRSSRSPATDHRRSDSKSFHQSLMRTTAEGPHRAPSTDQSSTGRTSSERGPSRTDFPINTRRTCCCSSRRA